MKQTNAWQHSIQQHSLFRWICYVYRKRVTFFGKPNKKPNCRLPFSRNRFCVYYVSAQIEKKSTAFDLATILGGVLKLYFALVIVSALLFSFLILSNKLNPLEHIKCSYWANSIWFTWATRSYTIDNHHQPLLPCHQFFQFQNNQS